LYLRRALDLEAVWTVVADRLGFEEVVELGHHPEEVHDTMVA